MPAASYVQDSFVGGKWSPYYQGRFKDEKYSTAMARALNVIPLEEGAAIRRPGFNYVAATRGGLPGALREFAFSENLPYNIEFTPGHIRFVYGNQLVLEPTTQNVVSISTDTPAVITTAADHKWATGDETQFNLPVAATDNGTYPLYNRQFLITVTGATTFTIADSVTGASIDGSTITLGPLGTMVSRVLDFVTPYVAADLPALRLIQSNNNGQEVAVILSQVHPPMVLASVTNPDSAFNSFATFTLSVINFLDGPYLDPVNDGGVITPTTLTGVVTMTVSYQTWSSTKTYAIADTVLFSGIGYTSQIDSNLNNQPDTSTAQWQAQSPGASVSSSGFVATDVGRSLRLFSAPVAWSKVAAYAKAATVEFDGAYWTALVANTGNQPGLDVVNWGVDTAAAIWTWGRIQAVNSPSQVTLQLLGGPLLYTTPINVWQIGRYSATTGYPTSGVFMEGRLWLAGLQYPNHFDGSMSNQIYQWSPSGIDGTVADNNAISETLNSNESNAIYWLIPDASGLVLGTQGGEWLVQASAQNDPLTPTSIQAKEVTKYGCENVEPRRTGITFMVVQRFAKKLLEYMMNVYNGKYEAMNVAVTARDLTTKGIAEIAYQRERTPIVWGRMNDGSLAGMTYKRERSFSSTGPTFAGWHQHALGSGRTLSALQAGPNVGGDIDSMTVITTDGTPTGNWIEILTDIADEEDTLLTAFNLDEAAKPWGADFMTTFVRLYGYHYLAGKTVTVWGGGLDLGDHVVNAGGYVDVPLGADGTNANGFYGLYSPGLFTEAYMEALAVAQPQTKDLGLFISNGAAPPPNSPETTGLSEFTGGGFQNVVSGIASGSVDWKNQLFLVPGVGAGSTNGFSQYSFANGGITHFGDVSQDDLFNTVSPTIDQNIGQGAIGQDGCLYWSSTAANSGAFSKMSKGLALVGTFGTDNGSTQSSQGHIARSQSMCAISCFDQFVLQVSEGAGAALHGGGGAELCLINGTTMTFIDSFGVDQPDGQVTAGRQTNDLHGHYYGEGFATTYSRSSYVGGARIMSTYSKPVGFWRTSLNVSLPAPATFGYTQVASITPEDIDPLWHWFDDIGGIAFDQTDGNCLAVMATNPTPVTWDNTAIGDPDYLPLAAVLGSDGHGYICTTTLGSGAADPTTDAGAHWADKGVPTFVNAVYLCKINSATGAIMWTIPLPSDPTNQANWNQSLIENSRLALLCEVGGADQNLYWIDTSAGTIITTTAMQDVVPQAQQIWGPNGLIVALAYTDTSGSPIPVLPCTGSFDNHWGFFEATPATPGAMFAPFVVGYNYTVEGMILRPIDPAAAGARNGPALGKTRRTQEAAWLTHNTAGVSFGVDFDVMRPAEFKGGGPQTVVMMTPLQLYSDVYWDKVDDDNTFDSRPCWRVTRPYPITILAVEAFLETQDR
jgi:hypothetical protein